MVRKSNKLVYGVGVYDSEELTATYIAQQDGSYKRVQSNRCYDIWRSMIQRCYSGESKFYGEVEVCTEWYSYSNFNKWYYEQQEQQGDLSHYDLDKDLINGTTKLYSPENCVFIPDWLNLQLIERGKRRGQYPLGVCKYKKGYISNIGDGSGVTKKYLGYYKTPEDAHSAWQIAKISKLEDSIIRLQNYSFGENTSKIYQAIIKRINMIKEDNRKGVETKTINKL
jgi:hypothetical protein